MADLEHVLGCYPVAAALSKARFPIMLFSIALACVPVLPNPLQAQQTTKVTATKAATPPETVGKANQVRNTVTASLDARKLAVSDPVYGSEIISASERSHGEILLNDDSKVIVGENSEISLDDFVIGANGFDSATLNVAKGAFRFISGNSPKGTFKIKTPLSTIGVRGTVFDVYVGEGGVTNVVLLQGAVRVCSTNNKCLTAERSCDIIEVRSADEISEQPFLKGRGRSAQEERQQFSLLLDQNRFDRRFRAPTAVCNARAAQQLQDNGAGEKGDDNSGQTGGEGGGGRSAQPPGKN